MDRWQWCSTRVRRRNPSRNYRSDCFLSRRRVLPPSRDDVTSTFSPEYLTWHALSNGVKVAVEQSTARWWENMDNWGTGKKGKYFLNHYYQSCNRVSPEVEAAVKATGKSYSAMSPKEFFANCYAEFFADPAGYADPKKWGGNLPKKFKPSFINIYWMFNHTRRKSSNKKGKGKPKNHRSQQECQVRHNIES